MVKNEKFRYHGVILEARHEETKDLTERFERVLDIAETLIETKIQKRGLEFFRSYHIQDYNQDEATRVVNELLDTNVVRRSMVTAMDNFRETVLGQAFEDWIEEEELVGGRKSGELGEPDFIMNEPEFFLEHKKTGEHRFNLPFVCAVSEVKCRPKKDRRSVEWYLTNKMKYAHKYIRLGIPVWVHLFYYSQKELLVERWEVVNLDYKGPPVRAFDRDLKRVYTDNDITVADRINWLEDATRPSLLIIEPTERIGFVDPNRARISLQRTDDINDPRWWQFDLKYCFALYAELVEETERGVHSQTQHDELKARIVERLKDINARLLERLKTITPEMAELEIEGTKYVFCTIRGGSQDISGYGVPESSARLDAMIDRVSLRAGSGSRMCSDKVHSDLVAAAGLGD